MGRDRHGPPSGLSEEERRLWYQARKFVWGPGDIRILPRSDEESEEDADGGRDRDRATGRED